jgi:hypothetical protein
MPHCRWMGEGNDAHTSLCVKESPDNVLSLDRSTFPRQRLELLGLFFL